MFNAEPCKTNLHQKSAGAQPSHGTHVQTKILLPGPIFVVSPVEDEAVSMHHVRAVLLSMEAPVSYTHLTLPTNREV